MRMRYAYPRNITIGNALLLLLRLFSSSRNGAAAEGAVPQPIDWQEYEAGSLGPYPQVRFQTTKATAPYVHVELWNETCDTGYTLLTPHGQRVRSNKALMLDHTGQLVWHHEEKGSIKSLQVQKYRGHNYLTYWVGDDRFRNHHGRGYYKMLDETYTLTHTISALDDLEGDYHEFTITPDNTALITIWQKQEADLQSKGRYDGYIWDCLFQEIDIETNTLLFQWRASDHFTFKDMKVDSWVEWTGRDGDPWDWFHLNSVDKDNKGNYLISARYTNAIHYINGTSGQIIWHLGGHHNSFLDITEGNATHFVDPHMARWTADHRSITVFDNVDFWTTSKAVKLPRGLLITQLHTQSESSLAKATTIFSHPDGFVARDEGSMHVLPNGHYFLSYGTTNVFSEFSPDGTLLCDSHYAPTRIPAQDAQPNVATYRINKQAWVGRPLQLPDIVFVGGTMYWSWNGATEVRSWRVEGKKQSRWSRLGSVQTTGFEMALDVPDSRDYSKIKLTAFNAKGNVLGAWIRDRESVVREIAIETFTPTVERPGGLLFYAVIIGSAALLWYVNRRPRDKSVYKKAPPIKSED